MQVQPRFDETDTKVIEEVLVTTDDPTPVDIAEEPLTNICQAINNKESHDTNLGYIEDENKSKYSFNFYSSLPPDEENKTLGQILESNAAQPYQFPPEKRVMVAAVLASSILQLQQTYWLSSRLDKHDIYFTMVCTTLVLLKLLDHGLS